MKFGAIKLDEAVGAILAHSLDLQAGKRMRKGLVLDQAAIDRLKACGHINVIAASLEAGDVGEDDAAEKLAAVFAGNSAHIRAAAPSTGRVNLYADGAGLFIAEPAVVDAVNSVDPGITLATLGDHTGVAAGRMVATVKIIPYAVSGDALERAVTVARIATGFDIRPYASKRVGMISTLLPQLKQSVIDKTERVLAGRLSASGSKVVNHQQVNHETGAVADALAAIASECDLVILFGASAISDRADVVPAAIEQAGGRVVHFGMPVDPGNLLLLGELDGIPVIGAPGCARSPAENGFDMVLNAVLAGEMPNAGTIMGMGVGGLKMEIGSRPQPREGRAAKRGKVAAVLLAAGQSRRMGEVNKLTALVDGKAMVRHVVEAAIASKAAHVWVVTGHEPAEVEAALSGLEVKFVHNLAYADGLGGSLAAGIGAVSKDVDAAIVLLGDMPRITTEMIDQMIGEFAKAPAGAIIQAADRGKRGNPVLWPKAYFEALQVIAGDTGAKHLIGENRERVVAVELGEAASFDLDTPQALEHYSRFVNRK